VVVGAGAGGGAGGTVVEVVVVVGGTVDAVVVVVVAPGRCAARSNAAASDVAVFDRCAVVWPKLTICAATTAQTASSRIGTNPTARRCRATGEAMGQSSWVWNIGREVPTHAHRTESLNRTFATKPETAVVNGNASASNPCAEDRLRGLPSSLGGSRK
jgi:hypothetical protein